MLIAIIFISFGILIHELGHYTTAKLRRNEAYFRFRWKPFPYPCCIAPNSRLIAFGGPLASFLYGASIFQTHNFWIQCAAVDCILFSLLMLLPLPRFDGKYIWARSSAG